MEKWTHRNRPALNRWLLEWASVTSRPIGFRKHYVKQFGGRILEAKVSSVKSSFKVVKKWELLSARRSGGLPFDCRCDARNTIYKTVFESPSQGRPKPLLGPKQNFMWGPYHHLSTTV